MRLRLLPLAALLGLAAAPSAAAAPPPAMLSAGEAFPRTCHHHLISGDAAGVAATRVRAPGRGALTVRLEGERGDWDLALFDVRTGRKLGASASFGARELVTLSLARATEVAVQACRRSGPSSSVPLVVRFSALPRPPKSEPVQIQRVALRSEVDLELLHRLGFDVTHNANPRGADVVTYSAAERRRLAATGLSFRTKVADLVAMDRRDRAREARAARGENGAEETLPSGRTEYRQYEDFQADLKALVDENPGLVRPITLPQTNEEGGSTIEGRPIEGVEIAQDVERTDDGRPVYVQLGGHHAREWPSAEMPMEFAIDLVNGYGSDPRITDVLENVRVVILPVVNVDGYIASRSYGPTPFDDEDEANLPAIVTDSASYRRKNCRPNTPADAQVPCGQRSTAGVDLNRNYGAYWGGVGSQTNPTAQQYRGTGPYSEPESEAFHQFSQTRHIVTIISNHTYTEEGTFLRQPGFNVDDDPVPPVSPDEAPARELGDAMRNVTGYLSQLGWKLGDITGATEDWNYFAQGAIGYTPEIRGPNFHGNFQDAVIGEYLGEVVAEDAPNPANDDTPDDESEDTILPGDYRGLGMGEAFLIAGEQAANPRDHSVLAGRAPAGRILRLHKEFETPTSQENLFVSDVLDTTLTVPASGSYEWHVNPSRRPLVAQEAWTMTCEDAGGTVYETREIEIERGERLTANFDCREATSTTGTTSGTTSGNPTTGPVTTTTGGTPPPTGERCRDTTRPRSRFTSARVTRRGFVLRGRSTDVGCTGPTAQLSRAGGVATVSVSLARTTRDGRCRFLRLNGRFTRARSCKRTTYLPTRGGSTWRLSRRMRLPRGRYKSWARAVDLAGNVERKDSRRNFRRMRAR